MGQPKAVIFDEPTLLIDKSRDERKNKRKTRSTLEVIGFRPSVSFDFLKFWSYDPAGSITNKKINKETGWPQESASLSLSSMKEALLRATVWWQHQECSSWRRCHHVAQLASLHLEERERHFAPHFLSFSYYLWAHLRWKPLACPQIIIKKKKKKEAKCIPFPLIGALQSKKETVGQAKLDLLGDANIIVSFFGELHKGKGMSVSEEMNTSVCGRVLKNQP